MSKNENFKPSKDYKNFPEHLRPFHWFCHKVLPLVYDDSLSYYEMLCKLVHYLNETMKTVDGLIEEYKDLTASFDELVNYVNTYFDNLDLTEEVRTILNEMAKNGQLSEVVKPLVNEEVDKKLDEMVANGTLLNLVKPFISETISSEIEKAINETIKPYIKETVTDEITETFDTRFEEDFDIKFGEDFAPNFYRELNKAKRVRYFTSLTDLRQSPNLSDGDFVGCINRKLDAPYKSETQIFGMVVKAPTDDELANYKFPLIKINDSLAFLVDLTEIVAISVVDVLLFETPYIQHNEEYLANNVVEFDLQGADKYTMWYEGRFNGIIYSNSNSFILRSQINNKLLKYVKNISFENNVPHNINNVIFYRCSFDTTNVTSFPMNNCILIDCTTTTGDPLNIGENNIVFNNDDVASTGLRIDVEKIISHWNNTLTPETLDELNRKITNLTSQLTSINQQLESVESEISGLNNNIGDINNNISEINTNLATAMATADGNVQGIRKLQETVETNKNDVNTKWDNTFKNISYSVNFDLIGINSDINTYAILNVKTQYSAGGEYVSGTEGTYPSDIKPTTAGTVNGIIISMYHKQIFIGRNEVERAGTSGTYMRTYIDTEWSNWGKI